jgi:hypothetical protein
MFYSIAIWDGIYEGKYGGFGGMGVKLVGIQLLELMGLIDVNLYIWNNECNFKIKLFKWKRINGKMNVINVRYGRWVEYYRIVVISNRKNDLTVGLMI